MMSELQNPAPLSIWRTAVSLFKLRIVALLLLAAFGGAALAAAGPAEVTGAELLLLAVTGTLSAAGASAINQYLERDRDRQMARTAGRLLPTGRITRPERVFWLALGMVITAVLLAAVFNPILAFWTFLGAVIYVLIYTVWLKPRSSLNIVIGGAAGSCAVICGGAAVGDWHAAGVWLLAGLLFVWTPVHFWALALAYRQDYARAAYPMLPAQVSPTRAVHWIALHALLTISFGAALGILPQVNYFLLLPATAAGAGLIYRLYRLYRDPQKQTALALFHFSNLYLAVVLIAAIGAA